MVGIKQKLCGSGFSPSQAREIAGQGEQGLVALGTNQATGLVIGSIMNSFATVAASTGSVLGSNLGVGDSVDVYNGGASTLTVYPSGTSDTIDNTSSVSVVTKKGVLLVCTAISASSVLSWVSHGST